MKNVYERTRYRLYWEENSPKINLRKIDDFTHTGFNRDG